MRDCTCGHVGICVTCRHTYRVEYLPIGVNVKTLRKCHPNPRLGYNHRRDTQAGGCSRCWSDTWRWHCSGCGFVTLWVEENVAADEVRLEFLAHNPNAWL
jgi:hypothetical protein